MNLKCDEFIKRKESRIIYTETLLQGQWIKLYILSEAPPTVAVHRAEIAVV